MLDIIAPALGAIAIGVGLLARSMPGDRALIGLNTASLVLWASHFLALGGYGAAASLSIGAAISFATISGRVGLSRGLLVIEVTMIPIIGTLLGFREMLPLVGGALFSLGVAIFAGRTLTLAFLAGELVWLTYSIWLGANFAIASGLMALLALVLRTVQRTDREQRSPTSDEHEGERNNVEQPRNPRHD